MPKKVAPLSVEIDEVALSVLGWEVSNCAARLKTEDYDDCWASEVAVSMELRFHPDDWSVRHDSGNGYLPCVVWQLRSRSKGPVSNYAYITIAEQLKDARAPKMWAETSESWESKKRSQADDLYVWVGAFDWDELDTTLEPGHKFKDVPVEVIDQTTLRGVRTELLEVVARIRDKSELDIMVRSVHPLGTGEELMAAAAARSSWAIESGKPFEKQGAFEVDRPSMQFQIFDETGFLLDSRDTGSDQAYIGQGGVIPRRPPTSVAACSINLRRLSGKPARVVIRLADQV